MVRYPPKGSSVPLLEGYRGYSAQLHWDHETGHWTGQIQGTEVRFSAGNYFAAVKLFESTADVLADQESTYNRSPPDAGIAPSNADQAGG